MGTFLLLINFVIFISIFYLQKLSTNKKIFHFFCFILFTSLIIYNFKGNKNSFSYTYKLEKEISESTNDPDKFANLNPRKIVFFLEKNKLKKQPNDFEGWMLLARTCFISGHFQKQILYNTALKFFSQQRSYLIRKLAMLRKNTNQLMSALSILEKIYQINPRNLDSIKLNLEILKKLTTKNF